MAKRNAQGQPKRFNLDLESLLISDESQDEHNDSQASSAGSCEHPNKFKYRDSKSLPANKIKTTDAIAEVDGADQNEEDEEIVEFNEVSKFFENVGNDFGKSMQVRRTRLSQFTEAIISVYESKLAEMVKRQECEFKEFKERTLCSVQKELSKGEEEFKKLKLQENKIIKSLEQQVKLFQKTSTNLEALIETFNKSHKNFNQAFEDLKMKHRNEVLELKKSLGSDMSMLQNKFLRESKKEEMQTVKTFMDRVLEIFGYTDTSLKAQIFLIYIACAVLVTVFVNWALAALFVVLKPFTCAVILLTFFRPDIAQNFLNEAFLRGFADKSKTFFCEIFIILSKIVSVRSKPAKESSVRSSTF